MRQIIIIMLFFVVSIILQIGVINTFGDKTVLHIPLLFTIYLNWRFPSTSVLFLTIIYAWGMSFASLFPLGFELVLMTLIAIIIQHAALTYFTNQTMGSLFMALLTGFFVYYTLSAMYITTTKSMHLATFFTASPVTNILLHIIVGFLFLIFVERTRTFYEKEKKIVTF